MTTLRASTRHLPGVSFEVARPAVPPTLPRMDVTAFVGLAVAGPFDVPVHVEDPLQFRDVFGPDVSLAEPAPGLAAPRSLLGASVEAFFAHGGRSCWVTRGGDAAAAVTTRFVVPGLIRADGSGPATVEARSPGSGFDHVRVAATARRRRLRIDPAPATIGADAGVVRVAAEGVRPGDLLELRWDDGLHLWAPLRRVERDASGRLAAAWEGSASWWRRAEPGVRTAGATCALASADETRTLVAESHEVEGSGRSTVTTASPLDGDVLGSVLSRPGPAGTVEVMVVDDASTDGATGQTRLVCRSTWVHLPPPSGAGPVAQASVVTLGLAAFAGGALVGQLEDLDPAEGGARWWGALPNDADSYWRRYRRAAAGDDEHPRPGPLDDEVAAPRFALAAPADCPAVALPLGLADDPLTATRSPRVHHEGPEAGRDGVSDLSPDWFLDPSLAGLSRDTLWPEARRRFFVDDTALRGMHAVLPLEDVAVVAVPDAAQIGWREELVVPASPLPVPALEADDTTDTLTWTLGGPLAVDGVEVERSATPDFTGPIVREVSASDAGVSGVTRPELTGCDPWWFRARSLAGARRSGWSATVLLWPGRSRFAACEVPDVALPSLELADGELADVEPVDEQAAGEELVWHEVRRIGGDPVPVPPGTAYELESDTDPGFAAPEQRVVTGPTRGDTHTAHRVPTDRPAHRWFRVRRRPGGATAPGAWSGAVVVEAAPHRVRRPVPAAGVSEVSVAVHRGLATLTAARRDLTAQVGFPSHYREPEIAEHLARVRAGAPVDEVDLLHAHHPWLGLPTPDGVVWAPPDGAVAGALAAGAVRRGVWIATPGTSLGLAVGVQQRLDEDAALALRTHQVNAVVRGRNGVVVLGTDTLAAEPAVQPVPVRRLLVLLRRFARREGRFLAFENNGPLLWGIVRTRFEDLLGQLYRRGALAGSRPAAAYRVICDATLNPPASVDAGRLVVELQVAPAHPLEFLRVRFVQTDDVLPDLVEVAP